MHRRGQTRSASPIVSASTLAHRTRAEDLHLIDIDLARDDVELAFTARSPEPGRWHARLLCLATELQLDLGEVSVPRRSPLRLS